MPFWTPFRPTPPIRTARRPRCRPLLEALEHRIVPVQFTFNYDYDRHGFFDDPERRQLLEIAGQILGSRMTDSLTAITPAKAWNYSQNAASGSWLPVFTDPGGTIDLKPGATFHPFSGKEGELDQFFVPANEYIIFAGGTSLEGTTIGFGGPGSSEYAGETSWKRTVTERGQSGAAPVIGARTDTVSWGGFVTFDTTEEGNWHFGLRPGPSDKYDFLSTAIHELGHVVGMVGGEDKDAEKGAVAWIDGGHFIGSKASAVFGGSIPVDDGHWEQRGDGLPTTPNGPNFPNGAPVMMSPTVDSDNRSFSALDWAALDDIGWDVSPMSAQLAIRFTGEEGSDERLLKVVTTYGSNAATTKYYDVIGRSTILTFAPPTSGTLKVTVFATPVGYGDVETVESETFTFSGTLPELKTWTAQMEGVAWGFGSGHPPVGLNALEFVIPPRANDVPVKGTFLIGGWAGLYGDTYTLSRSPTDPLRLYARLNGGTVAQPLNTITDVRVDVGGGSDSLTLDYRYGSPLTAGGLRYDAGVGSDSFAIVGGRFTTVSYSHSGDGGSLILDGIPVQFTDVEAVALGFNTVNLSLRARRLLAGGGIAVTGQLNLENGGTLGGDGAVLAKLIAGRGSRVAPGEGTEDGRAVVSTKAATLGQGSTFALGLDSSTTAYDRLAVTGAVVIDGATLAVTVGSPGPAAGQVFLFLDNDGTDAVQGTFAGLDEGRTFAAGGYRFRISYRGGTGNDVTLTALNPAPAGGGLTLSTDTVSNAGTDVVTATARGFSGRVDGVKFWFDTNRNGFIDEASDAFLRDHQGLNFASYSFTGVLPNAAPGAYAVLAQSYGYVPGGEFFGDTLAVAVSVVAAPPVQSRTVKLDGERRSNVTTAGAQTGGFVRMDGHGNQGVVYNLDSTSVSYKRYNANGDTIRAVTLTAVTGRVIDVAMIADGSFLVVWEGSDLRVTGFDATGAATGFVQQVDASGYRSGSARVAHTAPGTFAIAWERGNYFNSDIYLRRFVNGTFLSHGPVNAARSATSPAVALDADGYCFVAWTQSAESINVHRAVYGPTGVNASRGLVNGAGEGIEYWDNFHDVAALPGGGFVLAYTASRAGTDRDILLRRYSRTGTALDASAVVANSFLGNNQYYPKIGTAPRAAHDHGGGSGRFVVAWSSIDQEIGQTGAGAYAQVFDADLNKVGGELRANTTTAGSQSVASVAVNADDRFTVGWTGNGPGDPDGVFFQRFRFNDGPTDVALPLGGYVSEATPVGTGLSTVTVDDPDEGEAYTYQLIDGPGLDSEAFTLGGVSGRVLTSAVTFDHETKRLYRVRIRATDAGGLSVEREFTVRVMKALTGAARAVRVATFLDSDGDVYRVTLAGVGTVEVGQDDPDGDGRGPIGRLTVSGGNPLSSGVSVTVVKAVTGNGAVTIEDVTVSGGGLKALALPASDLIGTALLGNVTALVARDVKPGAFVSLLGPNAATAAFRVIGGNSVFDFGSLVKVTAVRVERATLSGFSLGQLIVSGSVAFRGDFLGDLELTGPANPLKPALIAASVAGDLSGATWTVSGQVGTIAVGGTARNATVVVSQAVAGTSPNPNDGKLVKFASGKAFDVRLAVARSIAVVSAKGWYGGTIAADSLASLGVAGSFTGEVHLRGAEVAAGKNALGGVVVTADTTNAAFLVNGNVGSFSTRRFLDSKLWAGFVPASPLVNPAEDPGIYTLANYRVGVFVATAAAEGFRGGSVVAATFGVVSVVSPSLIGPRHGILFGTTYTTLAVKGRVVGRNGTPSYVAGSFGVDRL